MAITISVALQKGGVGKSTTAETIAAILGSRGNRVLLVDMDSQANVTFISGVEAEGSKTITDVFSGEDPAEAIYHCKYYDLIPADDYLANLEQVEDLDYTLLKKALGKVESNYDFIIIDTPPALGNRLKLSLIASDYVLITTDARPLSIKGLDALEPTLEAVRIVSTGLSILGIVLVKYNDRTVLNRQIEALLRDRAESMNTVLFETKIRESVSVPESQAMQMSLIDYSPKSKPAIDYNQLVNEILDQIGG